MKQKGWIFTCQKRNTVKLIKQNCEGDQVFINDLRINQLFSNVTFRKLTQLLQISSKSFSVFQPIISFAFSTLATNLPMSPGRRPTTT